ncbi:MFS domain-containing protein [Fusarium keratoplasticum]|uniref:MFS domain-containing protein n=1 Tax=Fusarium keratoplasticum TaxID=1328300 RepID=A0ACC0QRQ2_9HYPO|nr:MFS domain-containing protein [Fusarium keratoplasticum]KAI8663284.1 MFS domain-containing protein [Fusarium keratoplasticum]
MAPAIEHDELRLYALCTKKSWWHVPHLIKLNLLLMIPFLTSYVGGFDGSNLNGLQTLEHWQEYFNHPRGSMLGLMVNMQVIGGVFSLPVAPWMADKYGRRHPIFLGSIIIIVGAVLQGCASKLGMFIGGRFCIGLGSGFVSTAAPPLLGELAYPSHRSIMTSLYNTTWYVGAIVAAWSTYGTFKLSSDWSWRIPSLLQAAVSIIQLLLIYLVPESPRWLIANDRTPEATKILCKYHSGTEEPTELVLLQVAQIAGAIEFERSSESVSYLQFFRTRGNRHRLFVVASFGFIIQWCGNQLISSYIVLVLTDIGTTDPETQNLINGGLQLFNWAVACGSALLVERLGRRFLLLTSTIGMLFAFIIWTILAARNQQTEGGNKGLGIGVVVMVFVFYAFYNFAMNPLPIAYLLEVLPYTLRAKGLTIFNLAQFCSGIFNGFANPVALKALRWKYYIVFVCALVLWLAIIYFTYPETRGLSLEEVSQVFDGKQALDRAYELKSEGLTEIVEKTTTNGKE